MMLQNYKSRLAKYSLFVLLWFTIPCGFAQDSINDSMSGSGNNANALEPLNTLPIALDTSNTSVGTIRKRVDEVVAFFTVTKGRKYVDNLRESDINIVDDGKPPVRISDFGHQSNL